MQLTLKGLRGEQNLIEIPDDSTILDLKAVIMSQIGHPVPNQKLLHKARILEDNKYLSEYNIQPNDTIVIMVTKSQEPSANERSIQELENLGLDREEAVALLERTNYNLEEAKKILIAEVEQGGDEEEEDEENQDLLIGSGGTFGFLRNSEEFYKIRDVLRRNPNEFENLMNQLQASNPELYELIKSNTEEFLGIVGLTAAPQVELLPQEEADIKELAELGYHEDDVVEAYITCDKNKELAASYLLENYQPKLN